MSMILDFEAAWPLRVGRNRKHVSLEATQLFSKNIGLLGVVTKPVRLFIAGLSLSRNMGLFYRLFSKRQGMDNTSSSNFAHKLPLLHYLLAVFFRHQNLNRFSVLAMFQGNFFSK